MFVIGRCMLYCINMSHILSVRLDPVTYRRLEATAHRTHRAVSTIVREAVSSWLAHEPRRATTLLAAAGSVRGSGVSATNAAIRASFRRKR